MPDGWERRSRLGKSSVVELELTKSPSNIEVHRLPSFTTHFLPQFRAGLGKRWVVKDAANGDDANLYAESRQTPDSDFGFVSDFGFRVSGFGSWRVLG
jgi:hypothetical protein